MKILIIEDDASLALSIKNYLTGEGFQMTVAHSLSDAKKLGFAFDLLILDWMLPDGQGLDYLKSLRSEGWTLPVLFLTAKADLVDRVVGLESGANDYILKPFEPRELAARIRVQLRKNLQTEKLAARGLKLCLRTREVLFENKKLETTRKEFDLLTLLMTNPDQVFTRDELLNKVWGFDHYPTTRTVDTHILQLRQKTRDDLIQTVRGVGYRFKTIVEN